MSSLSQAAWPILSRLDLSFMPLCEIDVSELVCLQLPNLKRLVLYGSGLHLPAVRQLFKGCWPALQAVSITGQCVTAGCLFRFCQKFVPDIDLSGLTSVQAFAMACQSQWPSFDACQSQSDHNDGFCL